MTYRSVDRCRAARTCAESHLLMDLTLDNVRLLPAVLPEPCVHKVKGLG